MLRQLSALFRQYRPTVVHTHIIGLNYAYLLMLRYRTPAQVHTVHNLAHHEVGVRVGACVRKLAFRYRVGGVVPAAVAAEVRASIQKLYGYPDPPLIAYGVPTDEYAPTPTSAPSGVRRTISSRRQRRWCISVASPRRNTVRCWSRRSLACMPTCRSARRCRGVGAGNAGVGE